MRLFLKISTIFELAGETPADPRAPWLGSRDTTFLRTNQKPLSSPLTPSAIDHHYAI